MLSREIIIVEEKDFLVVNKPAGVSVHGGEKVSGEILTDFLIKEYPEIKHIGDQPHIRPGIVHRLDKDTSGVMLVARTEDGFESLKKLFIEHKISKKYICLVCGVIKKDFWEMKTSIGRSKKRYTKQISLPITQSDEEILGVIKEAREAVTEFEVLERLQNRYTLLNAYPKTGRMHQIRVQLASFGFPVACDPLYGNKYKHCPRNLKRMFLHAEEIMFEFNKKSFTFHAPLPTDLENFLKHIRIA